MPPILPAVTVTAAFVLEPTIVEPFVLAMLQEYVPPPEAVETLPVEPVNTFVGPLILHVGRAVTVTVFEQVEVQPLVVTTTVTV